jgi:hypothetical protein
MSSVIIRTPVTTARPPHRWTLPRLHVPALRRRKAKQVFVAIVPVADIPPVT